MSLKPDFLLCIKTQSGVTIDSFIQSEDDIKIDDHSCIAKRKVDGKDRLAKIILSTPFPRPTLHLCIRKPEEMSPIEQMLHTKEIVNISGNASADEADVIFLNDMNHCDVSQQKIRGKIANALSNDERDHVFLCEGYDPTKIFFNDSERKRAFPENLNPGGTNNYYSGWDNTLIHNESMSKIRLIFNKNNILRKLNSDSSEISDLSSLFTSLNLFKEVKDEAHLRTEALWNSLLDYRSRYPSAKIFLFGGAGHFQEKWLEEKLNESGMKYCLFTPREEKEESKEGIERLASYYKVDNYGIFGNKTSF